MSFDFIVMIVSIAGLLRCRGRSNLWTLLLRQGVGYFVAAFTANLVTTIFLLLNLNRIMNIMFAIPAATASSIMACRSYVSLNDYMYGDASVHTVYPDGTIGTRVVIKDGNGIESPVKGTYRITIDELVAADSTGVVVDMDKYTSGDGTAPRTTATLPPTTIDIEMGVSTNSIDSQQNGSSIDEHDVQVDGRSF